MTAVPFFPILLCQDFPRVVVYDRNQEVVTCDKEDVHGETAYRLNRSPWQGRAGYSPTFLTLLTELF